MPRSILCLRESVVYENHGSLVFICMRTKDFLCYHGLQGE